MSYTCIGLLVQVKRKMHLLGTDIATVSGDYNWWVYPQHDAKKIR